MNWPAYADYVESNVPWLGALPAHWTTPHLGHITDCLDAVRIPLNAAERAEVPGDVPYWGANGVVGSVDRSLVDGELVLLGEDGAPFTDRTREKAFFVNEPIWPNNHIHVLRPSSGLHPKFLTHALNATDYSWFIEGSTREKLTQGNMSSIPIALPPTTEQCAIVDFLDRETAKIDALIAKQEQLIATLREDRAATITQAVTKGLDPNAEMKDSGADILGRIPQHWDLRALKRLVARIDQGVSPQAFADLADDGWGVLKSGCVNGGAFRDTEHKKLPTDFEINHDIAVRPGDLLVCRASGSPNLVGSAAIVRELRYQLILSDKTFRIIANQLCVPDYLEWAMNARPYREQVLGAISGAEGLANNLPMSSLRSFLFAVPPFSEQKAIVAHLDTRCSKIDALIDKSTEMIETLREYRSALITDAVTGKIDVWGWPDAAAS